MTAKIVFVGNCQAGQIADCLKVMSPAINLQAIDWGHARRGAASLDAAFEPDTQILCHSRLVDALRSEAERRDRSFDCLVVPEIYFSGLHPDCVYANHDGKPLISSAGGLNSAIALYGWLNGLSVEQNVRLFKPETFERIGYYDYFRIGREFLVDSARGTDIPLDDLFDAWAEQNPFMYVTRHPKLFVMADIARRLAQILDLKTTFKYPERFTRDKFVDNIVWSIYPGVAETLGLKGEFAFKLKRGSTKTGDVATVLSLEEFVAQWYAVYDPLDPQLISCDRFADARFRLLDEVIAEVKTGRVPRPKKESNPYRGLPKYHFWQAAMSEIPRDEVDPVVAVPFKFERETKIATGGSCFAQRIARELQGRGFNYYVVEPGSDTLARDEQEARQYGLFSARYGNIYTTRQLRQLMDRAYGRWTPLDTMWRRPDGRLLDPFRPTVEPEGFADRESLEADREEHLAAVRHMFETLDVFIFTLGLTEAWEAADGSVFPVAPGTVTTEIDMSDYRFVNYTVEEVTADLNYVIEELLRINPDARVILTVSPVSMIATYEKRHVLVSTTYTKSVLRVAAETAAKRDTRVTYFPSYEIVMGHHARGAYFEEDLRLVAPAGLDHVMRLFLKYFGGAEETSGTRRTSTLPSAPKPKPFPKSGSAALIAELSSSAAVVCDEELLVR